MQTKINVTGVALLVLAANSFAGVISEPSTVTMTAVEQSLTEKPSTDDPNTSPSPVPFDSQFDGDWLPSTDQSDAEAGSTTLAVMFTVYPSQSTASRSSTTRSSVITTTGPTGAHTSTSNSGGARPDARLLRCLILFAGLGGVLLL